MSLSPPTNNRRARRVRTFPRLSFIATVALIGPRGHRRPSPRQARRARISASSLPLGVARSISLFSLHHKGVDILVGLEDVKDDGTVIIFRSNRAMNVQMTWKGYQMTLIRTAMPLPTDSRSARSGPIRALPTRSSLGTGPRTLLTENGLLLSVQLRERGITIVVLGNGSHGRLFLVEYSHGGI